MHELDARVFGLTPDGDGWTFEMTSHLVRPDARLYGGTALSVSLIAMEEAAGRPPLWCTTQFVATAHLGETVEVSADVVASGRSASQVQVNARVGDRLVFSALGSCGAPNPAGMGGTGPHMPKVVPVEDCGPSHFASRVGDAPVGQHKICEFIESSIVDGSTLHPGHVVMWARVRDAVPTTAAKIGFLADMVPLAVVRATGHMGAGTSLDNALRVGPMVDTEWVLMELFGQVSSDGFGHGIAHCWAPDGTLMGVASQTAKIFTFEGNPFKRD